MTGQEFIQSLHVVDFYILLQSISFMYKFDGLPLNFQFLQMSKNIVQEFLKQNKTKQNKTNKQLIKLLPLGLPYVKLQ